MNIYLESVLDFSDVCIEFYDDYRIGNPESIKDYLRLKLGLTCSEAKSICSSCRSEF